MDYELNESLLHNLWQYCPHEVITMYHRFSSRSGSSSHGFLVFVHSY